MLCKKCIAKYVDFNQLGFCVVCRKESIGGLTHPSCMVFGVPDGITAPFIYSGLIRSGILRGKFGPKTFAILDSLVQMSSLYLNSRIFNQACDAILIPVPLDTKRLVERGFNQTELIAQSLAKAFSYEICTNALVKSSKFKTQAELKRVDRFKNVLGLFVCTNAKLIYGKDIILVDDITTTGATLIEVSKVLKVAGARYVWCFTLAKAGLNPPYWAR